MRRYTKEQIQEKLSLYNLEHKVVFDMEYLPRYQIKLECKTCGNIWRSHTQDAFIGCSNCYSSKVNEKRIYAEGMKIGQWILVRQIKNENGSVSWQCSNDNEYRIFTSRQLKHIRENGIPPYGANSQEAHIQKSCTRRKINESEFDGFANEIRNKGRSSAKYKQFKADILKRDGYICIKCGVCSLFDSSVRMQIHHLDNAADNEDLMYDPKNVVTICENCHKSTSEGAFHYEFGTLNNTREQFELWLSEDYEFEDVVASGLRPVEQLDLEGNILNKFRTAKEAAKFVIENLKPETKINTCYKLIGDVCRKRKGYNTAYGYRWRYIHENIPIVKNVNE